MCYHQSWRFVTVVQELLRLFLRVNRMGLLDASSYRSTFYGWYATIGYMMHGKGCWNLCGALYRENVVGVVVVWNECFFCNGTTNALVVVCGTMNIIKPRMIIILKSDFGPAFVKITNSENYCFRFNERESKIDNCNHREYTDETSIPPPPMWKISGINYYRYDRLSYLSLTSCVQLTELLKGFDGQKDLFAHRWLSPHTRTTVERK